MLTLTNLIGFGAKRGGGPTIIQQASATSVTNSITVPTVAAGDLIVFANHSTSDPAPAPALVTPSGFTNLANVTTGGARASLFYKLAAGTESGSSLSGMNGDFYKYIALVTFRRSPAAATATPSSWNSQITDGNPTQQTVSSSGGVVPLVVIGSYGSSGFAVDPRTFTVGGSAAKDSELAVSGNALYLAWKIYNSGPADVVVDMDDEFFGNAVTSGYIALS